MLNSSNKGQMFMAMDPSVFVDDFPTRLSGLMSDLRNLETSKLPNYSIQHSNIRVLSRLETLVSLNLEQFDEFQDYKFRSLYVTYINLKHTYFILIIVLPWFAKFVSFLLVKISSLMVFFLRWTPVSPSWLPGILKGYMKKWRNKTEASPITVASLMPW